MLIEFVLDFYDYDVVIVEFIDDFWCLMIGEFCKFFGKVYWGVIY